MRGSKAYVRRHGTRDVRAMILLDYIAEKGARIPREGNSDIELWADLRRSARRVGAQATFPTGIGPALLDDHIPFVEAGVPSIDLIDFDYPHRDTLRDRPDKLSPATLDAVGETVADLLLHWGR
jgi:Zn-dependent M28 family amino/carboxypeptidase